MANLDDKLEEAYLEARDVKAELYEINIEKSKLADNMNDRDVIISCMKDELENTKNKFRRLEKVNVELDESIVTLENTLESRDQKVYELEKEIKSMEETVPLTFSCDECKHVVDPKINLKDHTNFKHSDEDLPSTSKCGKCEYSSDDEGDLNKHI